MATRRPKRPRDPNQLGKLIVDLSIGEAKEDKPTPDALERLVQGYPGHGFVIHFDEAQTLFNNVREADTLERQVAGLSRLRRPASEPIIADLFSMFGATGAPRHVTRQSKKTASRGVQPGKERAENVAELRPDVARHGAPAEEDADSGRSGTQKPPRPPRQVATE